MNAVNGDLYIAVPRRGLFAFQLSRRCAARQLPPLSRSGIIADPERIVEQEEGDKSEISAGTVFGASQGFSLCNSGLSLQGIFFMQGRPQPIRYAGSLPVQTPSPTSRKTHHGIFNAIGPASRGLPGAWTD